MWKKIFSKAKNECNFVYILLDQYRNDCLNAHPIFEFNKSKSVRFSNLITYAPYTLASCHAVFSGQYGSKNGVNAYTRSDCFRSASIDTLTELLKQAGFNTYGFTFSHILIPPQGFDRLRVIEESDEDNIVGDHGQLLREIAERSRSGNFIFLHYGGIHHEVRKNVIRKYALNDPDFFDVSRREENRNRYLGYCHEAGNYLDAIMGEINNLFDPDKTVFFVTTDHGGSLGEKVGEKAYGAYLYDYTVRIWGDLILPSSFGVSPFECDTQVRTIDILPSIMELLNVRIPKRVERELQGQSFVPLTNNCRNEFTENPAFMETGGVHAFIPSPDRPNVRGIRYGGWKLIEYLSTSSFELFNLDEDPNEELNLYQQRPDMVDYLYPILLNSAKG